MTYAQCCSGVVSYIYIWVNELEIMYGYIKKFEFFTRLNSMPKFSIGLLCQQHLLTWKHSQVLRILTGLNITEVRQRHVELATSREGGEQGEEDYCFTCNEKGHLSFKCPIIRSRTEEVKVLKSIGSIRLNTFVLIPTYDR
jgi:Zinc knuckle